MSDRYEVIQRGDGAEVIYFNGRVASPEEAMAYHALPEGERRSPDQATAAEAALLEGTLPEEDRRGELPESEGAE